MKRAHVISLVFLFWQITKSELVGRRQRRLIHSDTEATAMLFLRLILFPTQNFLSAVFNSLLSTKRYQLLCANSEFFSCVCLLFSSSFHTHTHTHTRTSFSHDTFYIWDVLRSYFLIVFSKKKAKKQKQYINLFLMTWVQWLCSLLYLLGNNTVYPCLWQS